MPNQAENQEESQAEKELSARPEGTLSERSGERTLNSKLSTTLHSPLSTTLNSKLSTLHSNEVLVVGDSFYKDILPAQKAGCRTAWFKGEGWTDETYDETIPDMVITDLSDLLVIK